MEIGNQEINHNKDKNNDSMSPKYTTSHLLAYVARWSPTTF
jgi:hypothetical protein